MCHDQPFGASVVSCASREGHSGWGTESVDWTNPSGSGRVGSSSHPPLFSGGGSGSAAFPIKQESDRSSPLLHYYGGAHSMVGDDRFLSHTQEVIPVP
jgi:hypothetical protein